MLNKLLIASIVVVVVHIVCLYKAGSTQDHYWFYAMFAILATGLITFFGILLQNLGGEKKVNDQSMRLAIAGLVSSTYIALLAYTVFVPKGTELAKIAEDLVKNFTAIVGTVIAFYFGSAAYIEGRRSNQNSDNNNQA